MRNRVLHIVSKLLSENRSCNPEELCSRLGIVIVNAELPVGTRGFCLTLNAGKAIVLNEGLKGMQRTSCIAHELGHAMLHEGLNYMFMSSSTCMVTGRYEREANIFAAMLLLNGREIWQDETVKELSESLCLPQDAVEEAIKIMEE